MRRKILIVDDSASIRMLLKIVLGTGYDYVEANDGADGCTKASAERPDLILLDVQMPVKDGLAALEMLKSTSTTTLIPVLMVSTLVGGEDNPSTKAARALGAAGFIGKPIQKDALALAVRQVLGT